jgi:hypothetical protein
MKSFRDEIDRINDLIEKESIEWKKNGKKYKLISYKDV